MIPNMRARKTLGRPCLTKASDTCQMSHFFQILSQKATDVVIADENIYWLDGSETRNVPSLYMAFLFQKRGGVESRFTRQSQKTVTFYQQSAIEVPARLEFRDGSAVF